LRRCSENIWWGLMIYCCFHTIPPLGLEPIHPAVRHKVGYNFRSVSMCHLDVEPTGGQVSSFCLTFGFLVVHETRTFFSSVEFSFNVFTSFKHLSKFAMCLIRAWLIAVQALYGKLWILRFHAPCFVMYLYNIDQQNATFLNKYLNLWRLLHVSNPRVHLQEEGCTYRYSMFYMHQYKQSCR
jgi:hypothetical protein